VASGAAVGAGIIAPAIPFVFVSTAACGIRHFGRGGGLAWACRWFSLVLGMSRKERLTTADAENGFGKSYPLGGDLQPYVRWVLLWASRVLDHRPQYSVASPTN